MYITFLIRDNSALCSPPQLLLLINSPLVECTSSFFVISAIGLPRCVLGIRKAVAVVVHLDRRASVTIRSGYARFEHGNGSFRSRPAEGVNSPVALPRGYLCILKLAINPIPHGRIIGDSWSCKGPVLSDLSERYDLNSGCSVEPTLLLPLAVVLATETRPHNNTRQKGKEGPAVEGSKQN